MTKRIRKNGILSGVRLVLVAALSTVGCTRTGEDTSDPSDLYRQGEATDTLGTGRFYFGREIARVQTHGQVADWLNRPDREVAEYPQRLIEGLGLKPADVVADIGAGTGYFTFRLAEIVPHGRVFAVDIQPDMLDEIRLRMKELGVRNIELILGTEKDPGLPEETVDVAIVVGSYTEFYFPYEMMRSIFDALVPGGRLVLVEYRGEDDTLPVSPLYRLTESQARREMEFVGLRLLENRAVLPQQHMLVFQKPAGEPVR